ncbi:MAG TPA: hypothetical protein VGE21_13700 [Flavobacteriales bacterium]
MDLNEIQQKKPLFPVGPELRRYLDEHGREADLPLGYADLLRYDGLLARPDAQGRPTLWNSVLYRPSEAEELHAKLVDLYQGLIADGSHIDHLSVAAIDFCMYGNSQPFRIKIINQVNDNHDYYYIKRADASRVYGLEMEHLLSPNRINYLHGQGTLVEEHIIGVPGDDFIAAPDRFGGHLNAVRLSKEFIKFNERCFARLLGDMRAYNFVVNVIHDLDQVQYRLRAIDFDQQCYEGRGRIYLPQFYKENLPYVLFGQQHISMESSVQYRNEERSLLRKRYRLSEDQIKQLLEVMRNENIAPPQHVAQLREDLGAYHHTQAFDGCSTMGQVLGTQLAITLGLA